ncbi:MAG: type II toxin-antitoxin system ParD family antitoxin [Pseudomonadales bacterium]
MNISLPDPMRDWVEAQTQSGQYANNSDYVRDLIRRDQQRADQLSALQKAIAEGIASGSATQIDIEDIQNEAKKRAGLL